MEEKRRSAETAGKAAENIVETERHKQTGEKAPFDTLFTRSCIHENDKLEKANEVFSDLKKKPTATNQSSLIMLTCRCAISGMQLK